LTKRQTDDIIFIPILDTIYSGWLPG